MTYSYFFSLPINLLLISMLSVLLSRTSPAYGAPEYRYHFCTNTTTIPENSSNQSSLISLLSSISLYAISDFQFYSPTSSLTSSLSSNAISKLQKFLNISDPVYGLQLCRGDITTEECIDCVTTAAKFLAEECSRRLVAVVWYGECILRYSNASFFSTMDTDPAVSLRNTQNITETERFNQLLNTTMIDLASQASEVPAGSKKFATKEANFSELQTLYSLVQCTPDLSTTDCNACLRMAISHLPSGAQGANILSPSCYVWYEIYPFYNIIDTAPTPSPGLPPLPPREPEDKSQIPTVSIVAIVAPIVVSVVLFFLA